jgi:hypothetical protein
MVNPIKLTAAVTPFEGEGLGGVGATEPKRKRRGLSVVPDALRSLKTAANRDEPLGAGVRDVGDAPMDEDEIHLHVTYASHWEMDDAFCARLRSAIAAGRESAPIGVVTTPGTKNPRYVATKTEPRSLASSQRDLELA